MISLEDYHILFWIIVIASFIVGYVIGKAK